MRGFIHCLILLCIYTPSIAQPITKIDTSKYRITLPDYWKPGNKVWQILDEKLPTVAEELKDKQLCGDDCKPKYIIEFEMSEPEVLDYHTNHLSTGSNFDVWEIVTLYSFSSSLYLFDDKDKLLTKFILVDTNEIWRVMNRAQLPTFIPRPPMRISVLRPPYNTTNPNSADRARAQEVLPGSTAQGVSPYSYINNNKEKLLPTQRNMLDIIDGKIRSW